MEAGQSPPDVRTGEIHAVVVVPEGRGALLQRVGVVLGVPRTPHARRAVSCHRMVVGHVLRRDQVGRVAVAPRGSPPAVQVRGDRHGQLVTLANYDLPTTACLYGRTGEDPIV